MRAIRAFTIAAATTLTWVHQPIADAGEPPEHVNLAVQEAIKKREFDRAIAVMRPYAEQGDKDAQFSVAILFTLKAYVLHSKGSAGTQELERSAVEWLKKAAASGHENAADLYREVRKRGTNALYFPSIEHLLNLEDQPEPPPRRQKLVPVHPPQ